MSVPEDSTAVAQAKNVVVETTEISLPEATSSMTTKPKKLRIVKRIVKKSTVPSVQDENVEAAAKPAVKKIATSTIHTAPALSSLPILPPPCKKRSLSSRLLTRYGGSMIPELAEGTHDDDDDQDDDSDDQEEEDDDNDDKEHGGNHDDQAGEDESRDHDEQDNEKDNDHHEGRNDESQRTGGQPGQHRKAQFTRSTNMDSTATNTRTTEAAPAPIKPKRQPKIQIDEKRPDSPTIKEIFVEVNETGPMTPQAPQDTKGISPGSKRALNIIAIFVKIINVLFPLFFLALGILHIIRNKKETSATDESYTLGWVVDSINSAAITLWGIMFAAIAGQALKAYATFQAERGIKLTSLEQLLHSQSFSSTIKQPLLLRRIDITSICLFFLWALSPLTNQALQKMTIEVSGEDKTEIPVKYLDITNNNTNWDEAYRFNFSEAGTLIYSFAILSNSDLNGYPGTDIWGHPKLPVFDSNNNYTDSYSSEIGLPVEYNFTKRGNKTVEGAVSFTIPSAYWLFDCGKPEVLTPAEFNGSGIFQSNQSSTSLNLFTAYRSDEKGNLTSGTIGWASAVTPFDVAPDNNTEFVYNSCNLRSVGIESDYTCESDKGKDCYITEARVVPDAPFADLILTNFLVGLFASSNPCPGEQTSIAEHFMADPARGLSSVEHYSYDSKNILKLNATQFSDRFQRVWNTWYQTLYAQSSYVDGIDDDAPSNIVLGTFAPTYSVYKVQPAWLALYFLSVAVVLTFAVMDIYWEYVTVSPDFLGFASSLVRSNGHLNKKLRGLGGHEKAKAMADMKVMLQDVGTKDGTGKIALAPYSEGSSRLDRSKAYR